MGLGINSHHGIDAAVEQSVDGSVCAENGEKSSDKRWP